MEILPDLVAGWPVVAIGGVASLAAGLATGIGALPLLFLKPERARRHEAVQLGFAAGVMLAATSFSLILPAIDHASLARGDVGAAFVVAVGLLIGAVALYAVHRVAPHRHFVKGREGADIGHLDRLWLFVIAITLHNFPEGMAVGVGFGGGDLGNGLPLAIGIGLQNVPEGLAVGAAMMSQGYGRGTAMRVATLTGLVEPVGGLIGAGLVGIALPLLPWGLAFAAGAMLFIISGEIIPETHREGHTVGATFAVIVGFACMMLLDVTLG